MCDRSNEQQCNCHVTFGPDRMDEWCATCVFEFNVWLEEQAALAQYEDEASGRGWLWHLVNTRSEN